MDKLILSFAPIFAAGFAVQQLTELMEPLLSKLKCKSQLAIGLLSLIVGFALAIWADLRVLEPFRPDGYSGPPFLDIIVTGLVVSAGTEGVNSIMKFLGYAKTKKKKDSAD